MSCSEWAGGTFKVLLKGDIGLHRNQTFNLSCATMFSQPASLIGVQFVCTKKNKDLLYPHPRCTNIMWEIKVEICSEETHLFILTTDNSLPVPAERWTYISFLCFQSRPPTVWLVTAGSGPHISGTQLPCRHVLRNTHTHTHTHTHTQKHTHSHSPGKQEQESRASEQPQSRNIRPHFCCLTKTMYLQKRYFWKEQKSAYFPIDPIENFDNKTRNIFNLCEEIFTCFSNAKFKIVLGGPCVMWPCYTQIQISEILSLQVLNFALLFFKQT